MNVTLTVRDNLSLINPVLDQTDELYRLIADNRSHLDKHISFTQNKDTRHKVKIFLREIANFNIGGQKFNLLIHYDQQIIGLIGFHKIDRLHARAEIGYWIGEHFQGKGIMQDVIPKFLQYGFEALAVNKVELLTLTKHERNIRLVEKLGFKKEGILREHYFMHDSFRDAILYSMLKSEFLSAIQK